MLLFQDAYVAYCGGVVGDEAQNDDDGDDMPFAVKLNFAVQSSVSGGRGFSSAKQNSSTSAFVVVFSCSASSSRFVV